MKRKWAMSRSNQAEAAASLAFTEDRDLVYPALPRADLEQFLAAIKGRDGRHDAPELAADVDPWSTTVATRIRSLTDADSRVGYVRRVRGLLVLALRLWTDIDEPPKAADIYSIVQNIEGD